MASNQNNSPNWKGSSTLEKPSKLENHRIGLMGIAPHKNINPFLAENLISIGNHPPIPFHSRQFGLGSVYRPFLVRPANVHWELLRYSSDSQELQKCEFVPMDTRKEREKGRAEEGKEGSRRALKVQFDLPAGTYATVALRELMRTDFSKQAQKALEAELEEGRKREDEKKTEEEEEKDEKIRKEEEEKEEDGKRTEAEGKKRKTIAEVEMEGKRMKTDEEEKDEVKGEKSEADEKGN